MSTRDSAGGYTIEYLFAFTGGRPELSFTVQLDPAIRVRPADAHAAAEWTRLEYCRCGICPFSPEVIPHCPIALNLSGLAATFADIFSIEEVRMTVTVPERQYCKTGRVTEGLRSLLGVYLATSGCPHMDILRPMARFHLPFASMEETILRHFSFYFMRQFFEYQKSGVPDFSLTNLREKMRQVDLVNRGICRRLEVFAGGDSNRNALTVLNTITMMLEGEMSDNFEKLRPLFGV